MAPSRCATALIALVLPIGLASCGSAGDTTEAATGSTATAQESPSPTTEDEETASAEPTTEEPTTEEATAAGLGDWCEALDSVAAGVQAVIPDQGEWTAADVQTQTPGPDDTFTERVLCGMRQGEVFEGLVVGVTETQYPDEAAASESLAALRDDPDPMASSEEVDFGDEAIYTKYDAQMAGPPFISYSVTLREGDRVIRTSLRDHKVDSPADEVSRRAQVLSVVELLQR